MRQASACLVLLLALTFLVLQGHGSAASLHGILVGAAGNSGTSARQPVVFNKDFPHGEVGETFLEKHDDAEYRLYRNLWYHNSRFYAIHSTTTLAKNQSGMGLLMSKNLGMITIPAAQPKQFYKNLKARYLDGTTFLIDLPYAAFPSNIGHWSEILLPIYSLLSSRAWKAKHKYVDSILFGNLNRQQLDGLDWVWEMLKLVFAPATAPGRDLPHITFYSDFAQLGKSEWLGVEKVAVINDRYTYPDVVPGFSSQDVGRKFRDQAYQRHDIRQQHSSSGAVPLTITLLENKGSEQISNQPEVLSAMHDVGRAFGFRVRPLSLSTGAPFSSFLASMARTGVLVARHGPLLANAIFLPPGAVVVEMLPYNWEWTGISTLYRNISRSIGDIHHVAWRADSMQWAAYATEDDKRYGTWTPQECSAASCLDAHAKASMIVDTGTVGELIMETLRAVRESPEAPQLRAWPDLVSLSEKSTLWWQK